MPGELDSATIRLVAALLLGACVLLGACATQPAAIGEAPGDYEAFVRELMAEAAKSPDAAPEDARSAVRSAAGWLGDSEETSAASAAAGTATGS